VLSDSNKIGNYSSLFGVVAFSDGKPATTFPENAPAVHGTIDSVFRVEWRPLAGLTSIASEWHALSARALEPNVFYEPAFALAAARGFGHTVGAGLVWARTAPSRLVGFFPARIERRRYGVPLPVLVGWTHPYAPLGTPLVDRDAAAAAISAWLAHVARAPDLPNLLLMPYLPEEGALAQAFDAALAARNASAIAFGRHRRALLAPRENRGRYLDAAIGGKKRKELRRQRKRLGESGALVSSIVATPAEIAAALDDFLALEAAGWKGRAGTAASADERIRGFMREAVVALAQEGKARIARLFAGGQPIAAIVTLTSGSTGWCWKIAYDEAFARFSPGVQLLSDLTQALVEDGELARADSCATADHPMIDHLWRERLPLADRLVQLAPERAFGFALAARMEPLRRRAIAAATAVRDRVRTRRRRARHARSETPTSSAQAVFGKGS
jgi:CelD/BcsL family acetyltransferase involved in cellulose biosynthesis